MREEYDVGIIGAGASGMTAAIVAARRGKRVALIESNKMVGKKILATGNGKCNYTNDILSSDCYYTDQPHFVDEILKESGKQEAIDFLESLGIVPDCKNGYYYPRSHQAASVRQAFEYALAENQVTVFLEARVNEVQAIKQGYQIAIEQKSDRIFVKKIILSGGGCASLAKGVVYNATSLAQSLGHTIRPIVPALTGMYAKEKYFASMSGVRTRASVHLLIDNQVVRTEEGELQLTAYGISGIPVFQLCRLAGKALLQGRKVSASLDFLPEYTVDECLNLLRERRIQHPNQELGCFLNGWIPEKIAISVLKESVGQIHRQIHTLKEREIQQIVDMLKSMKTTIIKTSSFEQAQVMAGGVDINEVTNHLESSIHPGLFLTGELLDVDGICGGYNLQWAWSTGLIAGRNV